MNKENERLKAELAAKWQRRGLLAADAFLGALMLGAVAATNELYTDWDLYVKLGFQAGALKLIGKCFLMSVAGGGLKVLPPAPPRSYDVK